MTERTKRPKSYSTQAVQLAHVARLSSMGELVASIAHEVNQPLHVIAVFASTIAAALAGEGQWQTSDLRSGTTRSPKRPVGPPRSSAACGRMSVPALPPRRRWI